MMRDTEKNRRRPSGGYFSGAPSHEPPKIHVTPEDHAVEPVGELEDATPEHKTHTTENHHKIHNDLDSHSPIYMFGVIVLISAIGFFIWHSLMKDTVGGNPYESSRKGRNDERERDITLSSFNKQK